METGKKKGLKIRYQTNLRVRTSFTAIRQNGLQVLIMGLGWYLSCLQHSSVGSYKQSRQTGHTVFKKSLECKCTLPPQKKKVSVWQKYKQLQMYTS